jgi:hypothetical protein
MSPSEPPDGADVDTVRVPTELLPTELPFTVLVVKVAPVIVGLVKVLFVRVAVAVLSAVTSVLTNAVVAICVVLEPAVAVGAAGLPVKLGDARSALELIAPAIAFNSLSISVPLTILLESPVGNVSLVAKFVALTYELIVMFFLA